jgi:hypothetical protein
MTQKAVNLADLDILVSLLNCKNLEKFDRESKRRPWDGSARPGFTLSDERLFLRLRYMTGPRDNSDTLVKLQQDLRDELLSLLGSQIPAQIAVHQLITKIDGMKLTGFRSVKTPAEINSGKPFKTLDVIRVSPPPIVKEKGRQTRTIETVAIEEYCDDFSASDTFYRIVDGALRSDTISTIRNCLNCKNFFLRKGARLTYCSDPCEEAFNRERRTKLKYFRDQMRVKRKPLKKKRKNEQRTRKWTGGKQLFEKVKSICEKPKTQITAQDKDLLARVQSRIPLNARDLSRNWSELDVRLRKKYIHYGQVLC